jgi:hypothetical protein
MMKGLATGLGLMKMKKSEEVHEDEDEGEEKKEEEEYLVDFDVRVRTLRGQVYTLKAHSLMNIGSLKGQIEQTYGIPANSQNLLVNGKVLEDSKTLSHYKINADTGLQLIARGKQKEAVKFF